MEHTEYDIYPHFHQTSINITDLCYVQKQSVPYLQLLECITYKQLPSYPIYLTYRGHATELLRPYITDNIISAALIKQMACNNSLATDQRGTGTNETISFGGRFYLVVLDHPGSCNICICSGSRCRILVINWSKWIGYGSCSRAGHA